MTKLMLQNGKLLTSGGKLTTDVNCCCDDNCQPCCARLLNGALVEGEYRFFVENGTHSLEVKVTLDSGSDVVCDQGSMQIQAVFTGTGSPDALISFDPSWTYVSADPVPAEYQDNAGGYISWEGNTATEYNATLQYNACYHDSQPTWGRVRVSGHGLEIDLEFQHCPGTGCCTICPPCPPCCFRLATDGSNCITDWKYDGETDEFFQAFEVGDYFVVFRGKFSSDADEPGLICGDATAELTIEVSSRDPDAIAALVADEVRIDFEDWNFETATPEADNQATADVDKNLVWTNTSATTFEVLLTVICANNAPPITMRYEIGADFAEVSFVFSECDSENCNCCCDHCCGDCHFPVTTDRDCEDPTLTPYDIDGTRIINLQTTVTASALVFCDGTSDTETFEQIGASGHITSCICKCLGCTIATCRVSACSFIVTLKGSCGDPFDVLVSGATGFLWGIGSGGVGYVYWVTGRLTYSGDCEGASATGQFTNAGVAFTWETSFEVERDGDPETWTDCPLEEDSGGSGGSGE